MTRGRVESRVQRRKKKSKKKVKFSGQQIFLAEQIIFNSNLGCFLSSNAFQQDFNFGRGFLWPSRVRRGAFQEKKKKEISTGKINFFSRIRRIIFWRPKFVWFFPGNYVCCFADFRKFFLLFRFLFFLQSHHIAYFLVHSLANSVYFSCKIIKKSVSNFQNHIIKKKKIVKSPKDFFQK